MMKATGMVRRLDDLGRVVIPKELRRTFDLPEGAPLEIYTTRDQIILKKYQPDCIFCGSMEDLMTYQGKPVCEACRKKLKA